MAYIAKASNAGGFKSLTRYYDMLAGNTVYNPAAFESIASASGTGASGQIGFDSIPQTYKHLQLRFSTRSTANNSGEGFFMFFNNVYQSPFTQYTTHYLTGTGSSATASAATNNARITSGQLANASMASNVYDFHIMDILDYTNANKNPIVRWMYGWDTGSAGNIVMESGVLNIAGALTKINISTYVGNFTTDSKFALYGIKG